jgi:hypothetical protein
MFLPDRAGARALIDFRNRHGRYWKAALRTLWLSGRDTDHPDGSALRQLRNQGGPAWLAGLDAAGMAILERLAMDGDPGLATAFIRTVEEFLRGAQCGKSVHPALVLHHVAIACELGLKAYLLTHGWTDQENRACFGHRLDRLLVEAWRLGLPRRNRSLEHFVTQMGSAYAHHDIDALVASSMAIDPAAAHISVGTFLGQVKASIISMVPGDGLECPPPPRIDKA